MYCELVTGFQSCALPMYPPQHLGDTALSPLERLDRIFNRTFSATLLLNLNLPIPIRPGRHCPQLSFCKAEHVSKAARTRELIELRLIERDDRLIRHGYDRTAPRGIAVGEPTSQRQRLWLCRGWFSDLGDPQNT